MHFAESREEVEFLATAAGTFRELLERLGVWRDGVLRPPLKLSEYLKLLAPAPRLLLVHGNYLDDPAINYLVERRDRAAVCYCPRTHAYFEHDEHPLVKLLDAGVRVVLGTDSRASNPDLDVLEEWRFVVGRFPGIDPLRLLAGATNDAAWAIGLGGRCGLLTESAQADLLVVQPPRDADVREPLDVLLASERPPRCLMLSGIWCDGKPGEARAKI